MAASSSSAAIRVRRYLAADADALLAIFRSAVRALAGREYSHEQVMAWAPDEIDRTAWSARCASKPTWVAEVAGIAVGFVDLEPDGHVDMLYVDAAYQRRGVASALLRHLERAARRQSLARLYTEASIAARPFFERRGFQVVAAQTVTIRGRQLANYRMEKRRA